MGWVTASATSPLTAPAVKVTNLLSSCTLRFLRILMGVFTRRERPGCHVPAGGRSSGTGSTYLTERTRANGARREGGVRARRMIHHHQPRLRRPETPATAQARSTPLPLAALRPRGEGAERAFRHPGVWAPWAPKHTRSRRAMHAGAPVVALGADAPLPIMPPDLQVFFEAVPRHVIREPFLGEVRTVAVAADLLVRPIQHLGLLHPAAHDDDLPGLPVVPPHPGAGGQGGPPTPSAPACPPFPARWPST